MSNAFSESEERQALRKAVARAGLEVRPRVLHRSRPAAAARPPTCGRRPASSATSASTCPRSTAAVAAASATSPRSARSWRAPGCPLLMMVVSPAICGTVIGRFGTDEQKQRWLPGICRRHARPWRSRSPSPTPAPTRTRSPPPPAATATTGCSTAARSSSPASTRPTHVLVVGRTEDAKTGKLKPCLFVVPTDAPGLRVHADPDGDRQPGEAVPGVPRRRPAARRRAGRRRGRRAAAAVRRAQPGADHGRGVLDRAWPATRSTRRVDYAKEREVWGPPIGAHQGIAHPLAQSKIEIELARLMTQKAAALTTPATTWAPARPPTWRSTPPAEAAVRRRRPGRPDPRRQRA